MTKEILKQYLDRIDFKGQPSADLKTLREITESHTKTFAFENLNPLLGIPVRLDEQTLLHKFISDHRGGYCFEQNGLLLDVLKTIGFEVRGLLGKVYHKDEPIELMRRTHMILLVKIDNEEYTADVGCGGMVPPNPLRFKTGEVLKTSLEDYRFITERAHFILQVKTRGEWTPLYLFDLQEQYHKDYEVANWFTATYPKVLFTNHLLVSIIGENCRHTLFDNKLATHYLDRESDKQTLATPSQIREALEKVFKLRLTNLPGLDEVFSKLIDAEKNTK